MGIVSQPSGEATFTAVPRDASRLTKIKLVPSYGYQPLATLDHDVVEGIEPDRLVVTARLNDGLDAWRDVYGEIAPEDLNLSWDLCRALMELGLSDLFQRNRSRRPTFHSGARSRT
jgi:hypothetical protein